MKYFVIAAAVLFANIAAAHELTPTYPTFESSYLNGISQTTMKLWNRRKDASYYEIDVYDEEWNPIPFATTEKIMMVSYTQTKTFVIFIKTEHVGHVEFICTTSRLLKKDVQSTGITSRICSRVK